MILFWSLMNLYLCRDSTTSERRQSETLKPEQPSKVDSIFGSHTLSTTKRYSKHARLSQLTNNLQNARVDILANIMNCSPSKV